VVCVCVCVCACVCVRACVRVCVRARTLYTNTIHVWLATCNTDLL
jgi:hypothetical protein